MSQSTEEECLDINEHCPAWAGAGHCAKSKYVEKNCRVSCKVCTPGECCQSTIWYRTSPGTALALALVSQP